MEKLEGIKIRLMIQNGYVTTEKSREKNARKSYIRWNHCRLGDPHGEIAKRFYIIGKNSFGEGLRGAVAVVHRDRYPGWRLGIGGAKRAPRT